MIEAQTGIFGGIDTYAGFKGCVGGKTRLNLMNAEFVFITKVGPEASVEFLDDLGKRLQFFGNKVVIFFAENRIDFVAAAFQDDLAFAGLLKAIGFDGDVLLDLDG